MMVSLESCAPPGLAQSDMAMVNPFLTNSQADGERWKTDEGGRRTEAGLENSKKAVAGP